MKNFDMEKMIDEYKKELMQYKGENSFEEIKETEFENEEPEEAFSNSLERKTNLNSNDDNITSLEGSNESGYDAGRKKKTYESYEEFLQDNPETGYLRVQGFIASETFPATDCELEIRKELKTGSYLIHKGKTDESGIFGPYKLNAPLKKYSEEFSDIEPFASYILIAKKKVFITMIYRNLPIFPGVTSNQNINFVPANQFSDTLNSIVIDSVEPIDL